MTTSPSKLGLLCARMGLSMNKLSKLTGINPGSIFHYWKGQKCADGYHPVNPPETKRLKIIETLHAYNMGHSCGVHPAEIAGVFS
jgi:hypothetical protein